jgi:hypothetical protein
MLQSFSGYSWRRVQSSLEPTEPIYLHVGPGFSPGLSKLGISIVYCQNAKPRRGERIIARDERSEPLVQASRRKSPEV